MCPVYTPEGERFFLTTTSIVMMRAVRGENATQVTINPGATLTLRGDLQSVAEALYPNSADWFRREAAKAA